MAIATNNKDWLDRTVEGIARQYGVKITRKDNIESVVKRVNRQAKAGLPKKIDTESMMAYAGRIVRALGAGDKYSQPKIGKVSKKDARTGKFGAASSVRVIDPSTLDISKYL